MLTDDERKKLIEDVLPIVIEHYSSYIVKGGSNPALAARPDMIESYRIVLEGALPEIESELKKKFESDQKPTKTKKKKNGE